MYIFFPFFHSHFFISFLSFSLEMPITNIEFLLHLNSSLLSHTYHYRVSLLLLSLLSILPHFISFLLHFLLSSFIRLFSLDDAVTRRYFSLDDISFSMIFDAYMPDMMRAHHAWCLYFDIWWWKSALIDAMHFTITPLLFISFSCWCHYFDFIIFLRHYYFLPRRFHFHWCLFFRLLIDIILMPITSLIIITCLIIFDYFDYWLLRRLLLMPLLMPLLLLLLLILYVFIVNHYHTLIDCLHTTDIHYLFRHWLSFSAASIFHYYISFIFFLSLSYIYRCLLSSAAFICAYIAGRWCFRHFHYYFHYFLSHFISSLFLCPSPHCLVFTLFSSPSLYFDILLSSLISEYWYAPMPRWYDDDIAPLPLLMRALMMIWCLHTMIYAYADAIIFWCWCWWWYYCHLRLADYSTLFFIIFFRYFIFFFCHFHGRFRHIFYFDATLFFFFLW